MTQPDSRWWWGVLALGVLVLLWLVHAELLFTSTLPASYDLTGHVLPIAELKERLLPQGRLHGWSNDWFAGFPLYYFYFPLPALLAVALSWLFPLTVAIKIASVVGLLLLPFACYALLRACALARGPAAVAATAGASFALMGSFYFLGGNIASTVAGEFAFSISLSLSLFYLAALLRADGRPGAFVLPAILLAACALSHLVTTITIVAVAAVLLAQPARRVTVLLSWVGAFLLSAFWTLPFLLRQGEMAAVYRQATRSFGEAMPLELWPVLPGAAVGMWLARGDRPARPLILITLAGIALFLVSGNLVYPGRFLPYWFLGLHLLAGYALARALTHHHRVARSAITVAVVLPLLMLNAMRGTGYLRDWSGAAYGGLQARASWPVLNALFADLAAGTGRIYWEQAPQQLSELGSRNLAAATPLLAAGQPVANGLWLESSRVHETLIEIDSALARAQHDPHQLQPALGRLSELGVTRFVALTAGTAQLMVRHGLPISATTPAYAIFQVPGRPLVEADNGAPVEILEWSDERVRFRTTSPGTPHVVRMSWFPNWRARGGQLQRGPHSMIRVTPQQREVALMFGRSALEVASTVISVLAALGLFAAWLLLRRRSRPAVS